MSENDFIDYLREQIENLEDLVGDLESGAGTRSVFLLYVELDRLLQWIAGDHELLPNGEEVD